MVAFATAAGLKQIELVPLDGLPEHDPLPAGSQDSTALT